MNSIKIETIRKVKEKVEKILSLLGVTGRTIVSAEEGLVKIDIESSDSALIIGYHGENLIALRHIISLACRDILPEDVSVRIDVGNYLKNRERKIEQIVEDAAKRVKKSGKDEELLPMTSYERMLVHQRVSIISGVASHSVGEGRERKVVIKKEEG